MADENPETTAEDGGKTGGFFTLTGARGWILIALITFLQAGFWWAMMYIRESGSAPDEQEAAGVFREDPAILQSRVELSNFSATVPGPGGDLRPLNFNLVMELHYLPEERRVGATRPTLPQLEVF
ncbi:MAG: hypothetical protein LIP77_04560, partial [Planctomycetes bacterium]|nr:hypothetical protein [Planctomycetota bacterium]